MPVPAFSDLTDEGREIAKEKADKNPEVWRIVRTAVESFQKAGDIDYMRMSVAAKAYFMLSERGRPASSAELSESAKKLGWSPTPAEIEESINFLERLQLVIAKPRS